MKQRSCGTCEFNQFDMIVQDYTCNNAESENYGFETEYDDNCDQWEDKGVN